GCQTLGVDGEVAEAQMKNLFGLGWHPEAQQIIDADQTAGMSADQAIKDAQLGRAYATYQTPSNELSKALDQAVADAEARKGAPLDQGERRAARMKEAGIHYRKVHGESAPNGEALAKWMSSELHTGRTPVAGFDLTCSAPKSVSVVWAAADDATRAKIEQVHEHAIAQTLAWVEQHALLGRVGTNGTRKVQLEGAVATVFRHWTSRDGDPDLHDHIVLSNKGRRADLGPEAKPTDGWVTIDSRWLYKHVQTASAVYDQLLAEGMRELGYAMENRPVPGSKKQHIEVEGISAKTIEQFSSRRQAIEARTAELVREFEQGQGRRPDKWETKQLAQQANLETRQAKDQPLLLRDLVRETQERLHQELPTPRPGTIKAEEVSVTRVAGGIVADLMSDRATWCEHHVDTRVAMWAGQHAGISAEIRDQVKQAVLDASVPLAGPDSAPEAIAEIGVTRQYTSRVVIEQERVVLDAAGQQVVPSVMPDVFGRARDSYAVELAGQGKQLDEGQEAVARDFACSDRIVSAGIGPAGAGKTTAMKLVVDAARQAGVDVIGLSTTASAAQLLGAESGARTETLTMWNYKRGSGIDDGAYQLHAGDIIIVDEASMASTEHLAAVVADARNAGAFVRLMGDPNQLSSVTAGGLLRELDRTYGAVRLETLYRFRDAAEGLAGVQLATAGDLDWYHANDRVHGVAPAQIAETVMNRWAEKQAAGTPVLVMAKTNAMVDRLAAVGQDILLDQGKVDHTRTVDLAAHHQVAGLGDQIITREVDRPNRYGRGDFVKNGDTWTIEGLGRDGSATVVNTAGQTVTLSAKYLRKSAQLAYARTIGVSQGQTVEEAMVVTEPSMDLHDLYVAMSRGSGRNDAYVPLDGRPAAQILAQIAGRSQTRQTAHEMREVAASRTDDPARYIPIMRSVTAEADRARFD
ncbi:MAG: MobF family relaxase, partial [Brevibacterium linens]